MPILRAAQLSIELFPAASECHGCKHVLVPEHVSSLLNYMRPGDSATQRQQRRTPPPLDNITCSGKQLLRN
jgi:hypothetical protein